jgi:hypothetical protein
MQPGFTHAGIRMPPNSLYFSSIHCSSDTDGGIRLPNDGVHAVVVIAPTSTFESSYLFISSLVGSL